MIKTLDEYSSSVMSYFASGVGFLQNCDFMAIGAAILLVARLLIDLPKAYISLRRFYRDKSK